MSWYTYFREFGKIPCYHGTNKFFKTPDFSRVGENTADLNNVNIGFCLTDNRDYAADYAENASIAEGSPIILKAHIKISSPYEITNSDLEDICVSQEAAEDFKAQLIADGFDSIIIDSGFATEFCCFFPEQIHILGKEK